MNQTIITGSAVESHQLQRDYWINSMDMEPVTLLHRLPFTPAAMAGDVFYTESALEYLVDDAQREGRNWAAWRRMRPHAHSVRPFLAWLYLNEASVEELEGRGRDQLIDSRVTLDVSQMTHARFNLINLYRQERAAAVRQYAREHLVRICPDRLVVSDQELGDGRVEVRAYWRARPAAARTVPDFLVNGLESFPSRPAVA